MRIIAVPMVLALALALSVAGCAPKPEAAPTVDPVASETPTPTPTPEPTRPAANELIVSPNGLGTLRVGGPVPDTDNPATALVVLTPNICLAPGADFGTDPTEPGWVADPTLQSTAATYLNQAGTAPFSIGVSGSTVDRIDVKGAGPATAEGIQVGSSRAEVLAAYPDADRTASSPISEVYRIAGGNAQLLIEVAIEGSGWDGYWSGGIASAKDKVLIMRILPLDDEPRGVAGGDNVVFGCEYSGP